MIICHISFVAKMLYFEMINDILKRKTAKRGNYLRLIFKSLTKFIKNAKIINKLKMKIGQHKKRNILKLI